MSELAALLEQDPFQAYVYSYPHKTAYRALDPAVDLRALWAEEDRSALFVYLHVPFCEQRCGFCNLFTSVQPREAVVDDYLTALERQAVALERALRPLRVARMAIGGGTPTFLPPAQLERLFAVAERLGASGVPCSVEASPTTADAARIALLARHGVTRVSIGVQSAFAHETAALHRHQDPRQVEAALGALRAARIPTVNADLIYGLAGQTADSLIESIERVIAWGANELYLYPLYVRPLTTLGRRGTAAGADRLDLYRAARDHLRRRGWRQATMRMFRAPDAPDGADGTGRVYRCQDDGMVGLGPGARSYTRGLHYASPYAVAQGAVRDLIARWSAQDEADFSVARHGFTLDGDDQRRRWIMLSILEGDLDLDAYQERFASTPLADHPHLAEAIAAGLVTVDGRWWRLSASGMERSDVLGQWLYSPRVAALMRDWQPT